MHLKSLLSRFKMNVDVNDQTQILTNRYATDKNGSIFTQQSIQNFKNDLINFAKKDGNEDDLSEAEALDFLNYIIAGSQELKMTAQNALEEIQNLLKFFVEDDNKNANNTLNITNDLFTDNEMEMVTEGFLYNPNRTKQLDLGEIKRYGLDKLSPELQKRASEIVYIESLGDVQFDEDDIAVLCDLPENLYEEALDLLLNDKSFENHRASDAAVFVNANTEKQEILREILDNVNSRESSSAINGRKSALDEFQNFSYEQLQKVKKLISVKTNCKYGAKTKQAEKQTEKRDLHFDEIGRIIIEYNLSESEIDTAISLLQDDRYSEILVPYIAMLAKLSNAQIKRALTFNQKAGERQFSSPEIISLCKLSEEEFTNAQKYYNIPGRSKQFSGNKIAEFAQCSSDELDNFFKEHPNCQYVNFNKTAKQLTLKDENNIEYVFENGKIVTTISNDTEQISNNHTKETKLVKSSDNKTEQELIYEIIPAENTDDDDYTKLISEIVRKYDDNGELLSTTTLKPGNLAGCNEAYVTYPNGTVIPLQHGSIDSVTGNITVEKHFVSPEGVKTEYNYVETPNNTITSDYQITDADGNVIMEIHQMFEQISENKFVERYNSDVYEVEISDTELIISKDGNEKRIELNRILNNNSTPENREIILDFIKNIPPHQLLALASMPIKFSYDSNYNNASYLGSHELKMGNLLDENMFAVLMHEYGHYLDLYIDDNSVIGNNSELKEIFTQEYENMRKNTTTEQQKHMSYLLDNGVGNRPVTERVAEANSIINSPFGGDSLELRRYYYQTYFPRTISKINELIEKFLAELN